MCLRADATTSAIHVRLILPGECHGDYPPRLCHTPFTRIWPHEELCRFSALVMGTIVSVLLQGILDLLHVHRLRFLRNFRSDCGKLTYTSANTAKFDSRSPHCTFILGRPGWSILRGFRTVGLQLKREQAARRNRGCIFHPVVFSPPRKFDGAESRESTKNTAKLKMRRSRP